jgi:hypothetical protein
VVGEPGSLLSHPVNDNCLFLALAQAIRLKHTVVSINCKLYVFCKMSLGEESFLVKLT